jgi:hypothetical protein
MRIINGEIFTNSLNGKSFKNMGPKMRLRKRITHGIIGQYLIRDTTPPYTQNMPS